MRGAVGVALAADRDRVPAVEEDVDHLLAVAAGDDDRARPQRQHLAGEVLLGVLVPAPVSSRASGMFGVTTVASGSSRSTSARRASPSSSVAPLSATITGSTTTGASPTRPSASTTASTVATVPSIPIFTASTPMSSATARTWATIIAGETVSTASTPTVFCAVIAVIAVIPCTPQRANAFRSAWMPAPPPESEPAIERTAGCE